MAKGKSKDDLEARITELENIVTAYSNYSGDLITIITKMKEYLGGKDMKMNDTLNINGILGREIAKRIQKRLDETSKTFHNKIQGKQV
jgi:hypothetical protein